MHVLNKSNVNRFLRPFKIVFNGRNTPAQPLDVWSIWRDSDEVGNKYVWCVQLRRKLSEPSGLCQPRLSMRSLRRWAVRRLSHWILWLVVCQLNGHSDWRCTSESTQCVGGAEYCVHFFYALRSVISCFHIFVFCSTGTRLVVMSIQDEFICARCTFSMQLFLSEIVKFRFDWK